MTMTFDHIFLVLNMCFVIFILFWSSQGTPRTISMSSRRWFRFCQGLVGRWFPRTNRPLHLRGGWVKKGSLCCRHGWGYPGDNIYGIFQRGWNHQPDIYGDNILYLWEFCGNSWGRLRLPSEYHGWFSWRQRPPSKLWPPSRHSHGKLNGKLSLVKPEYGQCIYMVYTGTIGKCQSDLTE